MVMRLLPLPDAEEQTAAAEEPQTAYEADDREECSGPQEGLEEVSRTGRGAGLVRIVSILGIQKGLFAVLTEKPNLSKLSLVITTASVAFEKIQAVVKCVLKDLYESSSVFSVLSTGAM